MNSTDDIQRAYCNRGYLKTITLAIDFIFLVPIVTMNLLTLICCIRYRKLRTCTNALIASLAASDLLFGVFALAPGISMKIMGIPFSEKVNCLIIIVGATGSFNTSVSNLMMLSIERYIAICRPFKYGSWVTFRSIGIGIASCWCCNLFLVLLFILFNKWADGRACVTNQLLPTWLYVIVVGFVIVTFGLTVWCYFHVLIAVRKQFRRVRDADSGPCVGQVEIKKSIMMLVMFGLFAGFLLPIPILKLIEGKLPFNENLMVAKCLLFTLVKANHFSNFVVYTIFNRFLRAAILHLVCCSRAKLQVPE